MDESIKYLRSLSDIANDLSNEANELSYDIFNFDVNSGISEDVYSLVFDRLSCAIDDLCIISGRLEDLADKYSRKDEHGG